MWHRMVRVEVQEEDLDVFVKVCKSNNWKVERVDDFVREGVPLRVWIPESKVAMVMDPNEHKGTFL